MTTAMTTAMNTTVDTAVTYPSLGARYSDFVLEAGYRIGISAPRFASCYFDFDESSDPENTVTVMGTDGRLHNFYLDSDVDDVEYARKYCESRARFTPHLGCFTACHALSRDVNFLVSAYRGRLSRFWLNETYHLNLQAAIGATVISVVVDRHIHLFDKYIFEAALAREYG